MTPDPTDRPLRTATRGLARFFTGLALVAVAACGSGDDDVSGTGSGPDTPSVSTTAATASTQPTGVSPEPTAIPATPIAGPYTLRIPRIGVAAPVVAIQSNEDRVLEPPRDPSVAGWWSDGAAPGELEGSAVLVGHTVRNNGGGVFDEVGGLRGGDAIEVVGSDAALTYHVQSVEVLSKEEVARDAEQIFTQAGPGRLVIITCDDWDGAVWRSNIVTIAAPA